MENRHSIKKIVQVALLSCVGAVLMLWQFPFPWAPWLKIDFSDVPVLIGTFALGPVAGMAVLLVKNLLFSIFRFSQDELLGLPMNFIATTVMVLVASFVYNRGRTWKNALYGLILAVLASVLVMIPANLLIMPLYLRVFAPHIPVPSAEKFTLMVISLVVPFNLIKGVLNGILTFLAYKRVSGFFRPGSGDELSGNEGFLRSKS